MAVVRVRTIKLAAFVAVTVAVMLTFGCHGENSTLSPRDGRRVIQAGPNTAGLPYSPGILVGNTLYSAGTIGEDTNNNIVPGGIEAETRQALANLSEVLKAAGMDFQDVTSVTVYLTSFDDFDKFNAVYREIFSSDPPARTTVQVAALIGGARVELQMIAMKH